MTISERQSPAASPDAGRFAILAQLGPVVGLVCIILVFSVLQPGKFPTFYNMQIILMQTAVVGIAALGITVIIISAGIDLSVGSVVALTSVVTAILLSNGWPPLPAALGAVFTGCIAGCLTGLLITQLRVMPFIVTLGGLEAIRGLTQDIGNEQTVLAPTTWLNTLLRIPRAGQEWMLLPPGVWMAMALAVLVSIGLRYTRMGRHIFAIGSNEQTARLCGIAVTRTKILVYMIGGLFAGIAGVLQFSSLTVGDTTTATGMELDVIAAVVLGGASLSGGRGSVFGTLVGALIMAVMSNGGTKMGWKNPRQMEVTGCIIVLAVAIDGFQHRKSSARNV
jgi:ribose/xylose/arabinose/galactoside ABC-type transport system permease subunit